MTGLQAAAPVLDRPLARLPTSTWSRRKLFGQARMLARDPLAISAAVVLVILIASAIAAPLVAPHSPTAQDLRARLVPVAWEANGTWSHPLGTDQLGRDIFSRIMYGGRFSVGIGFVVVALAGLTGTILGLTSGYYGGWFDGLIMRAIDMQTALPYFLLAITIMVAVGAGTRNLIIVLFIGSWVVYARFVRATMLSLRREPFIESAITIGCSTSRIITRHALPNLAGPLVTLGTLELSRVILTQAGLSFLGLGVQPPHPEWGLMVAEGHDYITSFWWLSTWPGLMIAVTCLSINVLATWLRAVTDPVQHTRKS